MAMPPWAMVAGSLIGLDKLVFEPAGNIFKSVQGIRNDSNSADALAALQGYKKASEVEAYDPYSEGYMDRDTGAALYEAKKKRADELYKQEARPVTEAADRIKGDPTFDLSQDPRVYLASKGIAIDTTNPYTMEALKSIGQYISQTRNNRDLADSVGKGQRPNAQLLATVAGDKPGNMKSFVEGVQGANEGAAQKEFWDKQAETERGAGQMSVPDYNATVARNVAGAPGFKFSPTDYTSMKNSQRQLLEKTPDGPLQAYTIGTGGATETGVRQGFMLGPPKEVSSVQYTTPAKVMYPGAYPGKGGGGDGERKAAIKEQKAAYKAYVSARQKWREKRTGEAERAMNERYDEYVSASNIVGQNVARSTGKKATVKASKRDPLGIR